MIQANELRIGNWVLDRGGKMLRIDFFEHLQNGYNCKFGMENILRDEWGPFHPLTEYTDYAMPIPLTPEILEKCGFVATGIDTIFTLYFWVMMKGKCQGKE